jgi:cytoskeletal protein CcmA (bactofilin family)
MAIWKDQNSAPAKDPTAMPLDRVPPKSDDTFSSGSSNYNNPPARSARGDSKETVIAENLAIEGKIEGAGNVRVAGRFKGDVHVEGNLTIDQGAKVTGGVRASAVIIAGELEGNVDAASRVELLETGVLNGDLKAGSLTVAAGSRMRGQAEFGWEDKPAASSRLRMETSAAS